VGARLASRRTISTFSSGLTAEKDFPDSDLLASASLPARDLDDQNAPAGGGAGDAAQTENYPCAGHREIEIERRIYHR
jgi:hypothetical protein